MLCDFSLKRVQTVSVVLSFILVMVHYPEVQARAREEIDSFTGGSRIPDFGDRSSLPYIDALILELLRWAPPTPLGQPTISLGILFFADKYMKPYPIDCYNRMFTKAITSQLVRQYFIRTVLD